MPANKKQMIQRYFATLIFSMCLTILPLPNLLSHLNPDWVLLTLIYWALAVPERIGVFNAWVVGIVMDVLTGRTLGQQALVYALVNFTSLKLHKWLRRYPLAQQSLFIFISLLCSKILIFWIEGINSATEFTVIFWMPALVGTLFWALIYLVLRHIRFFEHH